MGIYNPSVISSSPIKKVSASSHGEATIPANFQPLLIVDANPDRNFISFYNRGENRVYLGQFSAISEDIYAFCLEPNGYYESSTVLSTEAWYGVASDASTINVIEY